MLQNISGRERDQQQRQLYDDFHHQQRQNSCASNQSHYLSHQIPTIAALSNDEVELMHKRQLILNTIEDLKRNLEDQSIELSCLNH